MKNQKNICILMKKYWQYYQTIKNIAKSTYLHIEIEKILKKYWNWKNIKKNSNIKNLLKKEN